MNNSPDHTNDILVTRMQQGDEIAFKEFFYTYNQRLFNYATRYVQQGDEIEDIISEAFMKLWAGRSDFENLGAMLTFLQTVVRNRCLDFLRHQAVRSTNQADLIAIMERGNDFSWEVESLRLELLKNIYEQVDKLPEKTRQVFLLSFREGLKPAEIAARLRVSVQTVRNQKLTALRTLKQLLKHDALLILLLSWMEQQENIF